MTEQFNEFIKRVYSFDFYKWPIKSRKLNPYKLAMHGYYNIEINKIQCSCCEVEIEFKYNFNDSSEIENYLKLVDNFYQQIQNIHKDECYYSKMSKNNLFHISRKLIYNEWEQFYQDNLATFQIEKINTIQLPLIDPQFEELIPREIFDVIMGNFQTNSITSDFNVCILFAIFGWKLKYFEQQEQEKNGNYNLFCQFCGRTINIKEFRTKSGKLQNINENLMIKNQENQKNKETNLLSELFNVIDEHRYFCKWGKIYGWNICINYLFEQMTKDKTEQVGIIDKYKQLQQIRFELMKIKDDLNKKYSECEKKFDEVQVISKKYELEDKELLQEKIQERKRQFDEIYNKMHEGIDVSLKRTKYS